MADPVNDRDDQAYIRQVVRDLAFGDRDTIRRAWEELPRLGGRAFEALTAEMKSNPEFMTVFRLGNMGAPIIHALAKPDAVEVIIAALHDDNLEVRRLAACALAATKDQRAYEPLVSLADDVSMRKTAVFALGQLGDPRALEILIPALRDEDPKVRSAVAWAIHGFRDSRVVEPLIKALGDADKTVRYSAASSLGKCGDLRAVEALTVATNDEDDSVRRCAAKSLEMLRGQKEL